MTADRTSRTGYLALIFCIGFAALIYQIYSIRVLFLFFVESTHAASLAISAFLAGLAFSSLLFSRLAGNTAQNRLLVRIMALAAGLYGYILLGEYAWIPDWLDSIHQKVHTDVAAALLKYVVMWVYLFFPAFFMGGAFPLVNGLYLRSGETHVRDIGTVYFWDTLGAIIGALVAGFVLLPYLGLTPTAHIAAMINFFVAIQLMERRRLIVLGAVCLALLMAAEIVKTRHQSALDERYGQVIFQKESPYGRVTVGQEEDVKTLFINYRSMCFSGGASEVDLAHEALFGAPVGSQALNIGLGCGLTAAQMAGNPHIAHLDIVEINPVVQEAAGLFAEENNNVLHAPNATLHLQDGAQWLRTTAKHYDAIVIDIEEVSVIYSSPLFTREYFEIARNRLKPTGTLAVWSFDANPGYTRVLYNTLAAVFPYVQIETDGNYLHCFASQSPLQLPPTSAVIGVYKKAFMRAGTEEINTLENRALEKYYNSNRIFGLPDDYRERFVR